MILSLQILLVPHAVASPEGRPTTTPEVNMKGAKNTPRKFPGRNAENARERPERTWEELQPALRPGNARCFDPVAGSHLADGFRKIIPDSAFREPKFGSNVAALHAFAGQA
jgi:hypothetical protein